MAKDQLKQDQCEKIEFGDLVQKFYKLSMDYRIAEQFDLYASMRDFAEELSDLCLKRYSIKSEDIRSCSNKDCDYIGFMRIDNVSGKVECSSPFECEKCGTTWIDPL